MSAAAKYEVSVVVLAVKLRANLPNEAAEELYYSIRRQIYGVPASAIPLKDLLHVLAEMAGLSDPSGGVDE